SSDVCSSDLLEHIEGRNVVKSLTGKDADDTRIGRATEIETVRAFDVSDRETAGSVGLLIVEHKDAIVLTTCARRMERLVLERRRDVGDRGSGPRVVPLVQQCAPLSDPGDGQLAE